MKTGKKWRLALVLLLLCGMFASCGVERDFVLTPRTDSGTVSGREDAERVVVIINQSTMTYHTDVCCVYAARMAEANRLEIRVPDFRYLAEHGYTPCSRCAGKTK